MNQKRITQLRARFGWTQAEFAEAVGVGHAQTISHWEIGFRSPSGAARRFLTYLEKLPDSDFKKAAALLQKIANDEK